MAIVQGPIVGQTKINLVRGTRAKPLPQAAVDRIAEQARGLIARAVARYEREVATGEVGDGGTARASDDAPLAGRGPAGLLYGRVQSGKTAAMTLAAAFALDNGFRIVVVVTANNVALVRQTAERFKALGGPRVFSTLKDSPRADYEWVGQEADLKQDLPEDGLVIVCAKDKTHLPAVRRLLEQAEAGAVPALIFDDEADAATPDTTLAARTSGRQSAPPHESTTHRYVIENTAPGEEGESLRETLPHHVFFQVTATPYVLLLQREDAVIRPSFFYLLEPGDGYCGGAEFFENFDPNQQPAERPIVVVPRTEAQALLAARPNVPAGLASSCRVFVLAGAMHALTRDDRWFPPKGYKHLSHTSVRIDHHVRVANLIAKCVRTMRHELRRHQSQPTLEAFQSAYDELCTTVPNPPTLPVLLEMASQGIGQTEVVRVNAQTGEPEFGPTYNFVVGGNILARGLTIDDLLVTYYLREAMTAQMDTVWQHARMYGYRADQMPYTRVYVPSHLGTLFRQIHESEQEQRTLLARSLDGDIPTVPILTPDRARPTRPGALEAGALRIFGGDLAQIVPYYLVPQSADGSAAKIAQILRENGVPLDERARENRFREVALDLVKEIVGLVPIREYDDGRWDADAVIALLDATAQKYGERACLYARPFDPGDDVNARRVRGVLSGPEVTMSQAKRKFVLALTYAGEAAAPTAWYPTLVVPTDLPPHVFNPF